MSFGPRRSIAVILLACVLVSPVLAQKKSQGLPVQSLTPEQLKQLQKQGVSFSSVNTVNPSTVAQKTPPNKNSAKKKDDKSKGDKKGAKPNATKAAPGVPARITRPDKFDGEPDPKELELRPDAAGKLRFNFTGQPWPGVLDWLAEVSECSLQWKELPGDFLTLSTRRSYTVDEARDIINKQLLSRGYTILKDGELLYVVAIDKLNKAMIPRVRPEDLSKRQPNEFVRVSFKLEWMVAGDAVTELKPMLSQHGKLFQLASSNRIEAFDTVANLIAIHDLLAEEQSNQVEEGLVRQFVVKHRRAEEVMRTVQQMMGINPDNPAQPMSSAQMKQIQKAIQQAQKSAAGQVVRQPVPTMLVLNRSENSILVAAEPDKMKQIEKLIELVDVPKKKGAGSMLGNMTRMKIYRLNTYDPAPLVKLLEELGELDPETQLQVDKQNRSIIAYATLADHVLIEKLIEKVDGASRTFSVLQLKELDASEVAGSIKKLMSIEEEDSNNYDYYYYRYRSNNQEKDKLMIEADVEKNRLLIRANSTELDEIKNLLRKMGEDPDRLAATPNRTDRVRTFDLPPRDAEEVIERLRKLWPLDNKLEIDVTPQKKVPTETTTTARKTTSVERLPKSYLHTSTRPQEDDPITQFFKNGGPAPSDNQMNRRLDGPPPVRISVRDGRIIVTSNDPVALAEVSRLLEQLLPAQLQKAEDYKVYTLEFVSPFWMAGTLEDFFDIDTGSGFFWGPPKKDSASLGKKKEMRFVTDSYTKTLVVLNATPEQHVSIAELIEIMDKPEQSEERLVRVTEVFPIKHSQATAIQNVIKEVYRDLLSGNDKDLQQPSNGGGGDRKRGGSGGSTPSQFFGLSSATYLTADEDEKVKFRGQLSVSADPISNTLTVSGTASLVKDIGKKIEVLDLAAKPASNMRVVPVSKNINIAVLQQRLEKLIGPKPPPQQQKGKDGQNGQPAPNQGRANR